MLELGFQKVAVNQVGSSGNDVYLSRSTTAKTTKICDIGVQEQAIAVYAWSTPLGLVVEGLESCDDTSLFLPVDGLPEAAGVPALTCLYENIFGGFS